MPLANRTIALAEGRQLEDLARMLEQEGATALRCPMVNILDVPDAAPVLAWLRELIDGKFNYVVFFTGEGIRRLLGFAERESLRDSVIAALGKTRTVTRGPKPIRALKEVGITPTLVAAMPTTEGVIAVLRSEPLAGTTVGVQLYNESNPPFENFLLQAEATARWVLPYIYAPATDGERVAELIERLAAGSVDAIIFTSSPQVDRLFEVAAERGLDGRLQEGMNKTKVAAIGPVVAENLKARAVRVDICPEQGFVMKNLVSHMKRAFEK